MSKKKHSKLWKVSSTTLTLCTLVLALRSPSLASTSALILLLLAVSYLSISSKPLLVDWGTARPPFSPFPSSKLKRESIIIPKTPIMTSLSAPWKFPPSASSRILSFLMRLIISTATSPVIQKPRSPRWAAARASMLRFSPNPITSLTVAATSASPPSTFRASA